jgi:hypothetical protein
MWRWEPAKYIHKQLRGFFDYFVLDEAHEEKSSTSAQGNAAGALAASCRKALALTGTLIGGYAEHIRPLMFRLCLLVAVKKGAIFAASREPDRDRWLAVKRGPGAGADRDCLGHIIAAEVRH